MLIDVIQKLLNLVGEFISLLLIVLPSSPFQSLSNMAIDNNILQYANYFLPFNEIVATLEAWGVAIVGYYTYVVFARWAKIID